MQAIEIMMHKILRLNYGILKNNNPYDPEIDRANRGKAVKWMIAGLMIMDLKPASLIVLGSSS